MSDGPITLTVNNDTVQATPRRGLTLLLFLRNERGLTGVKQGCGTGSCGACTVLVDGKAVQSCQTPLSAAKDTRVLTIEALANTPRGAELTRALIREGAAQCGYCLPGIVTALLADDTARDASALVRNLCRCGTQHRILAAVQRVSDV